MKVLIFGSNGLVGSSVVKRFEKNKKTEVIAANRKMVDLFNFNETKKFINDTNPNIIINAAAKVGGILANNTNRTEFILENLKINLNIIESMIGLPKIKLINLGSSCIYPLNAKNPINERSLMSGRLEPTNSPYAMAKLSAIELGDALSKQFGNKVVNLMPTNLYGPKDNFDPENSHVIPGLIEKIHKSKQRNDETFYVWGSGKPLREFLFVDDLSEAIDFIVENNIEETLLNIGSGYEVTISELVSIICEIIGYKGKIDFDLTKPDGNPRKLLDSGKINSYGWKAKTELKEGIEQTYEWYLENII